MDQERGQFRRGRASETRGAPLRAPDDGWIKYSFPRGVGRAFSFDRNACWARPPPARAERAETREKLTQRGDVPESWVDRDVTSAFRSVVRRREACDLGEKRYTFTFGRLDAHWWKSHDRSPMALSHRITSAEVRRSQRASVRFFGAERDRFGLRPLPSTDPKPRVPLVHVGYEPVLDDGAVLLPVVTVLELALLAVAQVPVE